MNDVGSTHTSPEGKNNCLTKLRDSFDTHMKYAEIIASFLFLSALTLYLIFLIFRKNFYQKFDIRKWQYKGHTYIIKQATSAEAKIPLIRALTVDKKYSLAVF